MAKPIALQLYSVREQAEHDFPAVLEEVADMGYVGVEFAGLHNMPPAEVKGIIDELGLRVCSAHMQMPTDENAQALIDECHTLGVPRLITGPGGPIDTIDNIMACVEKQKKAVSLLESSGIDFGLHNHWAEFELVEEQYPEDVMLDNVPGMFAELDVYWVRVGGPDPAKTVARLSGRTPLLHMKDGPIDPPQPHTAVGHGALDIPAIINAADPDVLEWVIVELDSCETDMMEAVNHSYEYLVGKGLAEGNR